MQLFEDANIYNLLPETYKNEYTESISYAINRAIKMILNYSRRIGIVTDVDNLPESILDELAMEYNIRIYNQNRDIQQKRSLIKNALIMYMQSGTKKDMEFVLSNIYSSAHIQEWFEYDGQPYHFRIGLTGVDVSDDDKVKEIKGLIDDVKNARSILEGIEIKYTITSKLIHHSNKKKVSVCSKIMQFDNLIIIGEDTENIMTGGTITNPPIDIIYSY